MTVRLTDGAESNKDLLAVRFHLLFYCKQF